MREFITRLKDEGDLNPISVEVDWNLEMGAITRKAIDLRAPAPLFQKVKGYPEGYRVLGCPVGPTKPVLQGRIAIAMELPKNTPGLNLIEEFRKRTANPKKPNLVPTGPCKENILKGTEVDLFQFPSPQIHNGDGGRFMGTWHIVVTKDPDTAWTNWGIYRMMIHDRTSIGIGLTPHAQHGGKIYFEKYERRKKPMPVAIAIGTEPISTIVSAVSFPEGIDHADMAGGIRGEGVEVVKCETVDLEVPATSEIVLEGEVPPEARKGEGPFGEYLGHFAGSIRSRPYMEVKAITHRNSPILPMSNMGKPFDECAMVWSIGQSAVAVEVLRKAGIPVKGVYMPLSECMIISVRSMPNLVRRIDTALREAHCRAGGSHKILVDEDVDSTDWNDVMWSITTRLHPIKGIHSFEKRGANLLMPWLAPEDREQNQGAELYLDSTWPSDWPQEYREEHARVVDFEHGWPQEIQDRVNQRWKDYGY
jgi:4-hydroxy-3-polyprenylbenzoate decarboxylase